MGGFGFNRAIVSAVSASALMLLAGCTTVRLTEPPQTATEQLLISTAVDRAVTRIGPTIPMGSKVFVDAQFVDTDNIVLPKYTVGAVRDGLLKRGAQLVDDKKTADIVVEMRTGAQSIDHNSLLIGLPALNLPIPLSSGQIATPEIALFKKDRQTGASKLAITAYSQHSGALVGAAGPEYGYSDRTHWVVLLLFSWTDTDAIPPDMQQ